MAGISDPLNFCKAEHFYEAAKQWKGPTKIERCTREPPADTKIEAKWHGINLTFDDGTICVVQFVRPTVWRVRYDPRVRKADDYSDVNSRTIVWNNMSQLVDELDESRKVEWGVELTETDRYYSFTSLVESVSELDEGYYKKGDGMTLHLWKSPFRIQAVRSLTPSNDAYEIPGVRAAEDRQSLKVVWQTSPKTFRTNLHDVHQMMKDVVLDIVKPGHGEYLGFGEQGGISFMKQATFMNYFTTIPP